jgi:nicotinamide-nucleotide amidase
MMQGGFMVEVSQQELEDCAARLGRALTQRGWLLVTAESCTGGWVSQAVTAVAGSSQWFDRGFVTYSNSAKRQLLEVGAETLEQFGAVSEQTALAMASGALRASQAQISVAVTGIAGPGGAVPAKPVGTVWFAWATVEGRTLARHEFFAGGRSQVRAQAVRAALLGLEEFLDG